MLPFGAHSIAAGVRTDLVASPQLPMGPPYRLVLTGDNLEELELQDVRFGMETPLLSPGPVPAALFHPFMPGMPGFGGGVLGVGMRATLGLYNRSLNAQLVTAVLSGTMAENQDPFGGFAPAPDGRPYLHPGQRRMVANAKSRFDVPDPSLAPPRAARDSSRVPRPPKSAPAHVWAAWVELAALQPPPPGSPAVVWESYYSLYGLLVAEQRKFWRAHPSSPTTRVREHDSAPEVSPAPPSAAAPATPEPEPAPPAAEQPTCEARRPDFGERCERPAGHRHDHEAGDVKWPQQQVPSRRQLEDNDRYLSDADDWGAWESPSDES